MAKIMAQIQKVYLDKHDDGTITCPNCQKSKRANLAAQKGRREVLKVKCGVWLRLWHHHRSAQVLSEKDAIAWALHCVWDQCIRQHGGRRPVIHRHRIPDTRAAYLQLGDLVEVRFLLDDQRKSELCKKATIKRIRDRFIGAEFCDFKAYDKELGFYLMPT